MNPIAENNRIEKELKGKRLICELAFDRKRFEQWRCDLPKGFPAWEYPHIAVALTVGVGVYDYEQGDYWHSFSWLSTPAQQNRWGRLFEEFLDTHETLESFRQLREQGRRFIAPILAHGGIPQYCLPDFFALITHHADYEQSSTDFVDTLKTYPTWLQNIDKPVQRFLFYGGDAAEDFTTRVFALWQSTAKGDGGGTHGLPQRVVDAFAQWYDENSSTLRRRHRAKNYPRASVQIKPGDLGVYLYLPRCDDHPEITANSLWKALGRSWAVTSSHEVPLPLAEKWDVGLGQKRKSLEGITSALPIMFFDKETGRAIDAPRYRRLPEHLWAVFPQSAKTTPSPSYSEQLPAWPGHQLAVFDLSGRKTLRIDQYEFEVRQPYFQVPEDPAVSGCQSKEGIPVFHGIPDICWEGPANLTLVKDGVPQGSIDISCNEFKLWFDEPGEYRFHLRGSLGQNVQKHFVFIPGLNVHMRPEVRWPTSEKTLCECSAEGFKFLSEDRKTQRLVSFSPDLAFLAVTESRKFQLVAEVPTFRWRFVGKGGEACEWRSKPLEISVQDLQQIDYPRLVFELASNEITANISMLGNKGVISPPKGYRSNIAKQNTWPFDLREVRDQAMQSGRAERFDVLLEETNGGPLFRGPVLSVRPCWDIRTSRAEWHKDKTNEIHITWNECGSLVADRWLLLIPLWRPWEDEIKVCQLSDHDRSSFTWRFDKLCPGRYLVRAIHAPWGCEDWLNAKFISECKVDVYKEIWGEVFCHEHQDGGMEDYLENLLVYWYRPELVKLPPKVPIDLSADDIRKVLVGFKQTDTLEKIRIPRDNSGSLAIFCLHPQETSDAVSNIHAMPEIWQKILPSQEVINLDPSQKDKQFIQEIVCQYAFFKTAARSIKQKFKQRSLSPPLKLWHKTLMKKPPAADDLIFLCEKYELFSDDVGPTLKQDFGLIWKQEYENFKQPYIDREAI